MYTPVNIIKEVNVQQVIAMLHIYAYTNLYITVLSRASAHPQASVHPPILTVLWLFEVLRITAHHAKFLRSESKVKSTERIAIVLMCFGAMTSGIKVSHIPVHSLVRSVRLQYVIRVLQPMNASEGWQ